MTSAMTDTPEPAPPSRRWGMRVLLVLLAAVALPLGAVVLYTYSPADAANNFYPRCIFHSVTGLHCPGCGATRCVAALLHGEIEQAVAYNALIVLLIPVLAVYGTRRVYEWYTGTKLHPIRVPTWAIKLLIVFLIAYWIGRNIDVYPLSLLAPHEI